MHITSGGFMSKNLNKNPVWWPEHPPIYDIEKSYQENLEKGPFFEGVFPERIFPPKNEWVDFLGVKVASRLGVPAGPLLNANWVIFAAYMGFDIVTYKTIRSRFHPAHPLPNMIYVDTHGALHKERYGELLQQAGTPPKNMAELAVTNSFGIPSQDHDYLIADIERANAALHPGQVMIVSVVGTPRPNEDFFEDFALAASLALEGGAKIIEADFSCPNVASLEGSLFSNPEAVYEISKRIKKVIGSIPLVIKVGVIDEIEVLAEVMRAAARAGVGAICGINTISMQVINAAGKPALGENRMRAGVCGAPIREVALDFLRMARSVNTSEKLGLTIMGTGGVILPEHFDLFFKAGADIAMSAAGMMWDPYLAARTRG